jgi:hypothetical protein
LKRTYRICRGDSGLCRGDSGLCSGRASNQHRKLYQLLKKKKIGQILKKEIGHRKLYQLLRKKNNWSQKTISSIKEKKDWSQKTISISKEKKRLVTENYINY